MHSALVNHDSTANDYHQVLDIFSPFTKRCQAFLECFLTAIGRGLPVGHTNFNDLYNSFIVK